MRVVQLLTQTEGGPADHAADVAAELARRGVDSHVVGPRSRATDRATGAGVIWHDVHVLDKRDMRSAGRALSTVRRLAADVVHLQDRRAGLLGRTAPLGSPVVYTLHGVADGLSDLVRGNVRAAARRRRDRTYYLRLERLLGHRSSRVVVPSLAVADFARDHVGLPGRLVEVVPNGVDPELHRPDPGRAAGAEGLVRVVWLGGLVPVKRPLVMLDAVAALPGVHATLVGEGRLADAVRSRADALGLGSRVVLAGQLADPRPALRAADAYALTSAAENCPLSLLQAMATSLPVVATAVGGVPEVVRPGRDGLLVRADDPGAFVRELGRLVDDAVLRSSLGEAGRQRILGGYTLAHCVDRLQDVYERTRGAE
jgi:glycosyltransferase involved in cell wall biosynthesis